MNPRPLAVWRAAEDSLAKAGTWMERGRADPAASASAFAAKLAVTAYFMQAGRELHGHDAHELALRRDLIQTRRVPAHVGDDFVFLHQLELRRKDNPRHPVDEALAVTALGCASGILEALRKLLPASPN